MESRKTFWGVKLLFGFLLCLTLSIGLGSIHAEAAPKLNKKKITLTVGKTAKLKVKGTKKKVKWSSSKKSVCTVSKSGTIKAKKAGTATIKAKVAKKTLKCKVTVKAKKKTKPTPTPTPTPVTPTALTVTGPFTKLAPGGSMQLTLGYVPSNAQREAVKWSCGWRASVSDTGLVTAKQTGEVTVTAELKSNWRVKGSFTFTIEDLTVDGTVSTADGGDLLLSVPTSKAVYNYKVSYTTPNVQTQVLDAVGNVIRTYPHGTVGPEKPVSVAWDLTDSRGSKVSPGSYCFQVVAAGTQIKSSYFAVYADSEFGAGNGSAASPYEISSLEQLKMIYKHNGVCFKQTADIDANYTEITPLFTADVPFNGTYDGGGFSIISVNTMTSNNNIALFTAIGKDGTVKNLNIKDSLFNGKGNIAAVAAINHGTINTCTVSSCNLKASDGNTGALAAENYGTIRNCKTTGNTLSASGHLGGVAGYSKGTVIECTSDEDDLALIRDRRSVGGVVGYNDGNIVNCTITSVKISSKDYRYTNGGGIAGYNSGTVARSTVEAFTLTGSCGSIGGIIGYNDGNNTSNNYQGSDYNQTGNGK